MSILANSPPHVLVEATEGRSVDVFVFRKLTEKPQKKKVEDVESVEGGEEE